MESKQYIFFILTFIMALSVSLYAIPNKHSRRHGAVGNKSHHLIMGHRARGDMLIVWEDVVKNSSSMEVVTVEKTFNTTEYRKITLLAAFDRNKNGTGGYASVVRGGLGHRMVRLKFQSQPGYGINFVVKIYGR